MKLRAATLTDLPALIECAADFFAKCPEYPPPVPDMLAAFISDVRLRGFVLVADDGARICGSIGLSRARWAWNPSEFLQERWWHADGAGAADLVIEGAQAIARRLCLPLYLGDKSGARSLAKVRLLQRRGFTLAGASAVYRPI